MKQQYNKHTPNIHTLAVSYKMLLLSVTYPAPPQCDIPTMWINRNRNRNRDASMGNCSRCEVVLPYSTRTEEGGGGGRFDGKGRSLGAGAHTLTYSM